jgi:hypothetical protein
MAANVGGVGQVCRQLSIGSLPNEVLLEIFDSLDCHAVYIFTGKSWQPQWHMLVHVCQRWRYVVFSSPCRLGLQIICTPKTRVREMLDIWPNLPITVHKSLEHSGERMPKGGMDEIAAALGHKGRICRIQLFYLTKPQLKRLTAVMRGAFPELTVLDLHSTFMNGAQLEADSLLGGFAPRLQTLRLHSIPFPSTPILLWSARNLLNLDLVDLPYHNGMSPEAMVTNLATLTKLKSLKIRFQQSSSYMNQLPDYLLALPRPHRSIVLPALTDLSLACTGEYLESFVARLHAPLISSIGVSFFYKLIPALPQLSDLIGRAETLKSLQTAVVNLSHPNVSLTLSPSGGPHRTRLSFGFPRNGGECQLSSIAKACHQVLCILSDVDCLKISEYLYSQFHWPVDDIRWLEFFRPFTAVRTLHLSSKLCLLLAPVFQEPTGDKATEVFPALRDLIMDVHDLSGPVHAALEPFLTTRQLSGHPVDVRCEENIAEK